MMHYVRTWYVIVSLLLLAMMWGSAAWFQRHMHAHWEFQVLLWSIVCGITANALAAVYHLTRPHVYMYDHERK